MQTRTPWTALALAWAAALALPASASAATVATDRACYAADRGLDVQVRGEGYTPGAQVLVLIDGGIVAAVAADAQGVVATAVGVPDPPEAGAGANDREHRVALQEGANAAETRFRSARVRGDFSPGSGDPARLKVRFSAFGFGLASAAGAPAPAIFVHYVDPKGKARHTIRLGTAQGPCGSIRRTAKRRLFPFAPRRGRWTLQYDTNARYVKGTARSAFAWDRVTLTIS